MRHWQVNMMKLLFAAALLPFMAMADAQFEVKSVSANQSLLGNGSVDITLTIQGSSNDVVRADCTFVATNSETKAAIPVAHITHNGDVTGEGTIWTRKFIWDAKADAGEMRIDDVELTAVVELPFCGVQLWEGGPYWAECNVGATKPEERGYYFWWGDTVGYKRDAYNSNWISVKDSSIFVFSPGNCPTYNKDNPTLQAEGYIDSTGNLTALHDAATSHLGAPWRLPTGAEISLIFENCTAVWTNRNGVYGQHIAGKGAYSAKSVFLPSAGHGSYYSIDFPSEGYYLSSTPSPDYLDRSFYLTFGSSGIYHGYYYRYDGLSVRPVREFGSANASVDTTSTHLSIDCTHVVRIELLGVTALQRDASNGLVDIVVTMNGASNDVADAVCMFFATNVATKAAIPVGHITRNGEDAGSGTTWTRKFIWDAKADVGEVKIDDVALTVAVELPLGGVQLWENGPYWAECNVGATKPEECGYYFWWGDTVGYKRNANDDGWISVTDGMTSIEFIDSGASSVTYDKYDAVLRSNGYIDATRNLVDAHDAAATHLGAPWRMPTDAELNALIANCTTMWTTCNGAYGRLVTGKGAYATKSIFLPAAGYGSRSYLYDLGSEGYYWSSSLTSGNSRLARYLFCWGSIAFRLEDDFRYTGRSVRPVREFTNISASECGAATHLSLDFSPIVVVASVAAQQRDPYSGLVDIVVTIRGESNDVAEAECAFVATNVATQLAIPVEHITRNGEDTGSGTVWTREFVWDAKADAGAVRIDDVALTVDLKPLGGVQLWEGGPYWAECNVGATKPEESGYYFWWGDTVGYKRNANDDGWVSVKDSSEFSFSHDNCPTRGMGNSWLQSAGYIDATGNLVAAHDAATVHLGAPWRMPTKAEFDALVSKCTTTWATCNDVKGRLITGKGVYSSKSIFLPAAGNSDNSCLYNLGSRGCDWSSTPYSDNPGRACDLVFGVDDINWDYDSRCDGQTVRPIRNFSSVSVAVGAATTHLTLECESASLPDGGPYTEVVDGVQWTYTVSEGNASVGGGAVDLANPILAIPSTTSGEITIPSTLGGCTVIGIGDKAFFGCDALTSVTIPESVKYIGGWAFCGCSRISRLTIPSSVTDISGWAFCECEGLSSVVISDGVKTIGLWAFAGCGELTSVSIPQSVTSIGNCAFSNCSGLTNVTFSEGLLNIGGYAFSNTGLTEVSIPTSVQHIGEDAFCGTPLMSSDNLFDLSVVGGWLLGYKYCTRPISPDEQPYEIPSARQTGGIVVPDGVRHIADGALREASGNSGDGIWGWTIDFSALTLPTGLETIGANAFGYGNAIDGPEVEIRIPASVVRIGSTLFSWCKNLKVVFEGDRPEAADDSFCDADVYWGDDETQPFAVYYMDGRSGWSNGELWAGAITFPSDEIPGDVRIDSPIRFADCPYWGFRFEGQMKGVPYKQEDCELKRGRTVAVITKRGRLESYQPTNGSFFALPVTGVSAKSEILPVFSWATANENMIADCQVLTDDEFRQLVSGGVSEATGWEKDEDDPDEVWLLQDFGTMTSHSREWPNGLWPNGVSDGDRYWIYVRINNLGYLDSELWSGDYTFRVGLGGTSEWTVPLHITFDSATDVSPSDMWRNVVFSGVKGWSLKDHHQGRFGGLSFFGLGLFSGTFPFEAEISVPSAGKLYLSSGEDDDISGDALTIASNIQILSDHTVWFQDSVSWDPIENFCAYVGSWSLRAVEVGSATTLSLKNTDTYRPELKLMRVQFYPSGVKSAAVEASYGSGILFPYRKWDSETYLQGRVTGTGVYSSSETVRLVATPGPGEAFDHWEVLLGDVPTGTNLLSPTLEFVMTDDLAGTPEERKQIVVRAVWRGKCAVTALPVEAGSAVIDGSGLYFDGEAVEFKVKPAEGYEFVKWLDGSTENPRAVSAVSGGGERIYYAVVEKSDDGPDPDGGPYEGVVDGDTWLYSFRLSHVSEEFGAVCSLQNGEVEVGPGGRETGNWAVSPAPTGAVAVPQEVDGYSVVALGCSAFEDSELTSVSLPNTIRYLGGWCLSGCKKLESVSMPDSVVLIGDKAFDGCSKLKSVQLSRNLEYISWHAFDGCACLTSICLPSSLKAIGEDAFVDCDALTSVIFEGAPPVGVLAASIKQDADIRYNAKYESEWLPVIAECGWKNATPFTPESEVEPKPDGGPYTETVNGVTWTYGIENGEVCIGYGWEHRAVEDTISGEVTIPSLLGGRTVTRISVGAFFKCSKLTSVILPSGVRTLDEGCFEHCGELLSIEFPKGLIEIGDYAFHDCGKLQSVAIPDSAIRIGSCAFKGCRTIESLTVPGYVANIGSLAFEDCGGLTSIVLGENVSSIGEDAFLNCDAMKTVIFEGAPPTGLDSASIKQDVAIRYCMFHEEEWRPVVDSGRWSDIKGYWTPEYADEKTLSDLLVGCRDVASSGAAEWFTKQMEGVWVLQSGAIADRQASTLSCKVDGAGVLTFKWKVSSDCFEDYQDDYLNVEVDGQEVAWIAGEKGWLEQRIELAASDKPHEVKWNYSKDKSDAAGCDCGWLKDVVWTPEAVCHVTVSSLYGEPTGGGEYACGTTVVLDAPLLPMPSQAGEGWFICRGSSGSPVLTNHIEFVATCDTNIVWDVWQTNWFVWCDAAFSASEYADVAVKITPPTESLEAALGIEPVNGGPAPFGSIVEINVALKPGYIVSSWQGAPEARPNDTNVTLVVTGDRTFTPIFSEGAYLPSDRTGGKVIAIDEWVAMDEMSFLYGDMFWWRFTQNYGNDFTSAILSPNGKKRADGTPMEVWEDFVAGTDPTDLGSKFTSKIEIVNGKPVISWDPELTPEQAARRVYTTYGCSELGGEWYNADEAPAEVKSQLRFFKVGVEMR